MRSETEESRLQDQHAPVFFEQGQSGCSELLPLGGNAPSTKERASLPSPSLFSVQCFFPA